MKNFRVMVVVMLLATLCFLASAYAQITPSGDSYTNTADPTTNYGSNVLLSVDGATEISYIQFNLASIPSGANVSQATLKLYVNAVTKAGSFNVDYVNGTWSESTITSNLAPALGAAIVSSVPITTASKNQYILINITPAVVAWLNGSQANDGVALVADGTFNANFDSKENTTTSHPAELDIVFAGGGGSAISGITTASGTGLIGGGTSGTLNLSLTNTCASGQVLAWSGTAWACANLKGGGTITGVTAGSDLTGGGTSGTVTLNLNTSGTDARYAQLNPASGSQTINGVVDVGGVAVSGSLSTNTLSANAATVGSFGMASFGPVGVGSEFNSKSRSALANLDVQGNGLDVLIGDPNCGTNFAGIGFQNSALANCTNYALIGDTSSNTYLNSPPSATLHLRNNNADQMTISAAGIAAQTNAQQARAMGGWVKAMAYVDPYASGGIAVTRCYNSQQTGSAVSAPPCGITLSAHYQGQNTLDFGFEVADRFATITANQSIATLNHYSPTVIFPVGATYASSGDGVPDTQLVIETFDAANTSGGDDGFIDVPFWVVVY